MVSLLRTLTFLFRFRVSQKTKHFLRYHKPDVSIPSLPSPTLESHLFFFPKYEPHHVPTSQHVIPLLTDALKHHESHGKENPSDPHQRNTRDVVVSESHHEPVKVSQSTWWCSRVFHSNHKNLTLASYRSKKINTLGYDEYLTRSRTQVHQRWDLYSEIICTLNTPNHPQV